MVSLTGHHQPLLLPNQTLTLTLIPPRLTLTFSPTPHRRSRRTAIIARFSPASDLPDFETASALARSLFNRAEGVVFTLADAAVSNSAAADTKQTGDWFSGITGTMETVLKVLKDGLTTLHVPYSYGFAIILLTVLVKAATFPLSKKQVESAFSMRALQPQVKAIQERYAGDQERIQLETARLYKLAGVNPLAGCLPTLATIPVWIGLYRALSNVANEGLLTEGFFWIPSLAGPTTVAARQNGSGISWIFPFVDGHPPLGWSDTLAYLVLPVLLVVSQYISAQIMQSSQGTDSNQQSTQIVTKILPLMIGYFALSVPSGLSLYWLTNNILSTAQQVWFQKLGGAKLPVKQYSDRTSVDELMNTSISKVNTPVIGTETEEVKASQGAKVDTGGVRPGERFKQLKEREARLRKQREEEQSKAEETPASSHLIEKQNTEAGSVENKGEQESVNTRRVLHTSGSTNGGLNYHDSSVVKDEGGERDEVNKEKAAEVNGSGDNKATADIVLEKGKMTKRDEP